MNFTNQVMRNTASKESVFELSEKELQTRLLPLALKVRADAWANNSYITYYDRNFCPSTDFIIHEYSDRKELMQFTENGETKLVKVI